MDNIMLSDETPIEITTNFGLVNAYELTRNIPTGICKINRIFRKISYHEG